MRPSGSVGATNLAIPLAQGERISRNPDTKDFMGPHPQDPSGLPTPIVFPPEAGVNRSNCLTGYGEPI